MCVKLVKKLCPLSLCAVLALAVSSAAFADDAQDYCEKYGNGTAVRDMVFSDERCSDLPGGAGAMFNNVCNSAALPNTPNCGVAYSGSAPAVTIAQCSAEPLYGPPPTPPFKYVLCRASDNSLYWVKLLADSNLSLSMTYPQDAPNSK